MRRSLVLVFTVAAATAVLAACTPPGGGGAPPSRGVFRVGCPFSHNASDDPIVKPGEPGASHSHDFFANTTTDASSTLDALLAGDTTCRLDADTSAYWVPAITVDGQTVVPRRATIYYRAAGKVQGSIEAFPPGLKLIAGDAHATEPQPLSVTSWDCGNDGGVARSSEPPTCPEGFPLRLSVRFPSCWNGTDLDSADHKSHLAYPVRRRCPSTHPVAVPALTMHVRYPTLGGPTVELASGGRHSAHADFFAAWDQGVLERLVERCLNGNLDCTQQPPVPA